MILNVKVLASFGQPDKFCVGEKRSDRFLVGLSDVLGLFAADEEDLASVLAVDREEEICVVCHHICEQNVGFDK